MIFCPEWMKQIDEDTGKAEKDKEQNGQDLFAVPFFYCRKGWNDSTLYIRKNLEDLIHLLRPLIRILLQAFFNQTDQSFREFSI